MNILRISILSILVSSLSLSGTASLMINPGIAPALADTERDCKGILNGASVLIGIMEMAIKDYEGAKRIGDREGMAKAKSNYIYARGKLGGLRGDYSRTPPCGSGDLLEDLGQTVPPFPS